VVEEQGMNYTSLLELVDARMNRSDLTALIPAFIVSVESEANTYLANNPVRPMIKTYTLTADSQRLDLPNDFIDAVVLSASDGTDSWPLARVGTQGDFAYYDTKALSPGYGSDETKPQQYKILGTTLVLSIVPTEILTLTLDCSAKVEPVNENNATNWLMDAHPDVYEFGTLAHAAKHVRDMEYYSTNRDLFMSALGAVPTAYPEKPAPVGLRMHDSPFGYRRAYYG
jgi:hypothetical protein